MENFDLCRMIIEIWSDIACPFCYLGFRQLELAITNFRNANPTYQNIDIVWKSFQLNPEAKYEPGKTVTQYLCEVKNLSEGQVNQMQSQIVDQGKKYNIDFQFDRTPVTNTEKAHILLHIAQKQGKGNQCKIALFNHHFSNGNNVYDHNILENIAKELDIDLTPWVNPFEDEELLQEIEDDAYAAQQFNIRGVPYFIFNRAYAISGAHGEDTFFKVLETVRIKYDQ